MISKVLIANRGAVARRIERTLRSLGLRSVAVYSDADRDLPHVAEADESVHIGAAPARESYLDGRRLIEAAQAVGADAVHPGYGFLSEDAAFAQAVIDAGLRFIGPSPTTITALAHKQRAREVMARHGMPVAPSSGVLPEETSAALDEVQRTVGFPLMLKPAGGGGGIGMQVCRDEVAFEHALAQTRRIAGRAFASTDVYAERLVERPRHVEFQILGDRHGDVAHLFERDCSVQRRHQKLIEESPAPGISAREIADAAGRAVAAVAAVGYENIGTVEMLHGDTTGFAFLEINARLQVEHAVTEAVTGIDLVAAQLALACGARLADALPSTLQRHGHAIEARVYAEDPVRFLPSPGPLRRFRLPQHAHVRVESGYREGNTVTPHYDPLLAKIIAWGEDREGARLRLVDALAAFEIEGVRSNLPFLACVLDSDAFRRGDVHTGLAADTLGMMRARAVPTQETA